MYRRKQPSEKNVDTVEEAKEGRGPDESLVPTSSPKYSSSRIEYTEHSDAGEEREGGGSFGLFLLIIYVNISFEYFRSCL